MPRKRKRKMSDQMDEMDKQDLKPKSKERQKKNGIKEFISDVKSGVQAIFEDGGNSEKPKAQRKPKKSKPKKPSVPDNTETIIDRIKRRKEEQEKAGKNG